MSPIDHDSRRPGCAGTRRAGRWWLFSILLLASCCGSKERADQAPLELRGDPIAPTPASTGTLAVPPDSTAGQSDLPAAQLSDDPELVEFELLSGYDYEAAAAALGSDRPPGRSAIPEAVRSLDGKEFPVKGFMLPLSLENGLVKEFLLMRDQSMCCFGVIPEINDWVSVKMRSPGVKAVMDQPVIVYGRLQIGEVYDNGILTCIYRMEGEELLDALDW